jgi:UDP-4-amino-4-deoxy-L-arabinose-oxoglutarate aminotransferase
MKIEFCRHNIDEKDIRNAVRVLRSTFVTTGPETGKFEEKLSAFLGVKHTLGVTSATTGLHLVLRGLGVGPGDEVIVPAMTFVATANVVEYCGARPVFVDVEAETGLIDPKAVEKAVTKRTKAVIPVHLYGQMADMKAIARTAKRRGLKIVEDAAHCIEGERDGVRPGALSDAVAFSFYATKNITCGEGGAVSTNVAALFERMKVLRLHGMSYDAINRYQAKAFKQYDVPELGYKYNMFDIQAALLIGQLERIGTIREMREKLSMNYEQAIDGIPGMGYPSHKHGKSARHLFSVWVDPAKRGEVIRFLNDRGIPVSVHFHPVPYLSYYRKKYKLKPGHWPNAERIGLSAVTLPLYPKLKKAEQEFIIRALRDAGAQILGKPSCGCSCSCSGGCG